MRGYDEFLGREWERRVSAEDRRTDLLDVERTDLQCELRSDQKACAQIISDALIDEAKCLQLIHLLSEEDKDAAYKLICELVDKAIEDEVELRADARDLGDWS